MSNAGVSVLVSGEAPSVVIGQVRAIISLPRILLLAWIVTLLAFGVAALWQVLPGNGSEKAVTIRARSDALGHEEITMSRGQTLEFTLISLDTTHTIVFEGLGVSVTAGPSETVTRRFTVDEAGTYTFRCIRPEHEGVRGTLTVTQ